MNGSGTGINLAPPPHRRSPVERDRGFESRPLSNAGDTVPVIVDRLTGKTRPAQVFVAVLGASNFTYAEASWTQALADWIGATQEHSRRSAACRPVCPVVGEGRHREVSPYPDPGWIPDVRVLPSFGAQASQIQDVHGKG